MKIIYKHGDLLAAEEHFIVQGCNAQGVMGSGVAKLIRDKDENVFLEYRKVYEQQGQKLNLGQTIWVESKSHVFVNAITQEFYGRDPNVVYVSYDGMRKAMSEINLVAGFASVAMPLIGAGLANGRWSIISQIIEEELTNVQPVVYLIDGIIPDGVEGEVIRVS
jgi:O-acetyl-ADP-ribose deacetylase (regulator of RNase III)